MASPLDNHGKLYVADTVNNAIRVVDLATGSIRLFAGNYVQQYSGDGGPATSASLNTPWGITVAPTGELFIADQYNHSIRKVALDLTISTVVGNGNQGYLGDEGPATSAELDEPSGVLLDAAGNLYIADSGNNVVRKVSSATGYISSVVGTGNESFAGDGGPANQAGLYGPNALALDGPGNLYIADFLHNRIREVAGNSSILFYADIRVGRTSPMQQQALENDGNAPLHIASIQPDANSSIDGSNTTCSPAQPLASDAFCFLGAQFHPQVTGSNVTGVITLNSDAANTPGTITLEGNVLILDPVVITVQTSGSPAPTGADVTFTVAVASTGTPGSVPTGTVTLYDGNTALTSAVTLNSSGIGTFTTHALAVGTHSITANYPGDASNAPGTSTPALSQVIRDFTSVALTSSANPAVVRGTVNFTATITDTGATPTGAITLKDGANVIATASPTNGVATFNISTLAVSSPPYHHQISAAYAGDTHSLPSNSTSITQVVNQSATTTVVSSSNPAPIFGTSINLTATVASNPNLGTPTGTVTFFDNGVPLGPANVDPSGTRHPARLHPQRGNPHHPRPV